MNRLLFRHQCILVYYSTMYKIMVVQNYGDGHLSALISSFGMGRFTSRVLEENAVVSGAGDVIF